MDEPDEADAQMAHFVRVCQFLTLSEAQIAQALAFVLGAALGRIENQGGPYSEQEWMDIVSEATASVTT